MDRDEYRYELFRLVEAILKANGMESTEDHVTRYAANVLERIDIRVDAKFPPPLS
jgi:hypothetical protein